jgi:hypothetical protein
MAQHAADDRLVSDRLVAASNERVSKNGQCITG